MILTICKRGNVRSVTLAAILKDCYAEKDVFAVGMETTTPEILKWLYERTNIVYYVGDHDESGLPLIKLIARSKAKPFYTSFSLGPDIWGMPGHIDLVEKLLSFLPEPTKEPRFYRTKNDYLLACLSVWHSRV